MNLSHQRRKIFTDYFPVPRFLLLATAGISITDGEVKIAELNRNIFGGSLRLSCLTKTEDSSTTSLLKKYASNHGIRFANVILPDEKTYLFTANLDKVPEEGIYDAVAFILEENVPISLSESVFSYDLIEESEDKIKLAVTVVSKAVVEEQIKLFESIGIKIVSFDTEAQATARSVVPHDDVSPQLIVNIGRRKSEFSVVEKEVMQFSVTSAYGCLGEDQEFVINELRSEMRKVFGFWDDRTGLQSGIIDGSPTSKTPLEKKISKILVSGSGASQEGFIKKLMNETSIPYEIANPWVNTRSIGVRTPSEVTKDSLRYSSVIGLLIPPHRNKYV